MSGEITVTPGQTFTNEDVTPTRLNNLGAPTMVVAPNAITTRELNIPEIIPNLTPIRLPQLFRNPTLQRDTWRDLSGVTCTADTRTDNAAGWYVLASGAAPTYAEAAFSQTLSYLERGAKITGNTSVTTVLFGQFVRADIARYLKAAGSMTISFALENQTGASLSTAVVSVQTTATENSGTSVSEATTGTVDTVADGAAAFVDVTITTSSIANLEKGFYLAVKFPSGSLDGTGKHVIVGGFRLEAGSSASTWEVPRDTQPHGVQVRHVWDESTDPDYTNDRTEGWGTGSKWRNSTSGDIWVCIDAATDNAVWRKLCANNERYHLFLNRQTSGTAGGSIATAFNVSNNIVWSDAVIEDSDFSYMNVGGEILVSPIAAWNVRVAQVCYRCQAARLHGSEIANDNAPVARSASASAVNTDTMLMDTIARNDATTEKVDIVPRASSARATDGLGVATSLDSAEEVYGIAEVIYLPEINPPSGIDTAQDVWTENVDLSSDLSDYDPNGANDQRTVLLIGQDDASENGLWSSPGLPTASQVDLGSGYDDLLVTIKKGTYAGRKFIQINSITTVGTDNMKWIESDGYAISETIT